MAFENNLLTVKNLDLKIENAHILKNLNFSILKNSITAIVGESGSGKSITAMSLMGLNPKGYNISNKSEIFFEDLSLLKISEKKIKVIYQGCNNDFKQEINNEIKQKVFKKFNLPNTFCLYVGSIEERKNLLTLLKAMTKVNNKYLDLVVIGKGKKYKDKCIKYIIKNNLNISKHSFFSL